MNAYQILEVTEDSEVKNIKIAYKKLVYKFHPDRFPNDQDMKREGGQRMEIINRAWYCLSDEDRRQRYDEFGEEGVGSSAASEQDFVDTVAVPGAARSAVNEGNIIVIIFRAFDIFFFLIEALIRAVGPLIADGGELALRRVVDTYIYSADISGNSRWKSLKNLEKDLMRNRS